MDLKQVEKSIERYWEGNSSIEEENQIRHFYAYENVPEHLEIYREVFLSPEVSLNPRLGKQFDDALMLKINAKPESKFWNVLKLAAIGLVLIVTSISVFKMDNQTQLAEDTFENPEEALAETKRAFLMIAEAMNKAEEPANYIMKLDQTNQKIGKKKTKNS